MVSRRLYHILIFLFLQKVNSLLMWKVTSKTQTTVKEEEQSYRDTSRTSDVRTTRAYLEPEIVSQEIHIGDVTDLKVHIYLIFV